ncbi:MAG: type II toxin-antitoxin system RelE/ParE family toxin [Magnetococcales bacterium]|nr:type II toxin-antitoxin system RelE/ParE family toxin [Magnetococcales bacterium]
MIESFRCKETERIFRRQATKRFPHNLLKRAKMRLDRIDAATTLDDLRVPPSHHLEALQGDRLKQHSIRINDQWRICFVWSDGNAREVEIVDYH